MRYAMLILPSANRVYADSAVDLTAAELEIFAGAVLAGGVADIAAEEIAGVPYVTFSASLDERDTRFLANLSSIYALFAVEGDLLRPIALRRLDRFDDDLVTIPKYAGKTNEQFTKLLLNTTLMGSAFAGGMLDRRLTVLDPLAGRGTTLHQAMMYGYDAYGVDRDQKDFEAYGAFIQRWLKEKRVKHKAEQGPVRRNRQVVGRRLQITLAASKADYKAADTQRIDMVNADTTRTLEFWKPGSVDLVVADAPYGVQHGSRTAERGLARGPLELLRAAAPVWAGVLRPGGALGLSWNTFVADRADAAAVLADAGLEVLDTPAHRRLAHRVDQAIRRDVLVARKGG
ncbi:SAM-dependent methyltransferase [Asanoa sp. WMMD1127]|uniref:TRM11 family SAM-dependent methyltransferase n=1 Tax=Asanoa sp. WMMD1127 TaxID=3016107 RepID=UPI0024173ADF|nr:SAM-dependent methyltransferase [Asanoa sp. WMMD1127]MDG4827302.1 SAM-dependent methyltransferase [Asanoa sp. WMMD1127]